MALTFHKKDQLAYLQCEELLSLGVKHAMRLRDLPLDVSSNKDPDYIARTEQMLLQEIGLQNLPIRRTWQAHGSRIQIIGNAPEPLDRCYEKTDGLMTDQENQVLVTLYADCTPIIFYDPVRKVLCTLHSGWKGTLAKISVKALAMMGENFSCKPSDIRSFILPGIGYESFEVDNDVAELFAADRKEMPHFSRKKGIKTLIDLRGLIRNDIESFGVPAGHIFVSEECTYRDARFHSFRRDKEQAGTMRLYASISS